MVRAWVTGHVVVLGAVEDVNAFLQIVGFERERVAGRRGPLEQRFDRGWRW